MRKLSVFAYGFVFFLFLTSCGLTSYPFITVVDTADVDYTLDTGGTVDVIVENSYMTNVRNLVESEEQAAGTHTVTWDLLDHNGEYPGDGLYTVEVFLNEERVFVQILEVVKQ
ncbi:MAG: hypothetical protein KAS73_07740 [Candidatus Sabulitectum sp.]|nr:hypothetical protein [Candidatus Sabulitectum sp.]